jgi:glutamate/aspartate transport system permease protein
MNMPFDPQVVSQAAPALVQGFWFTLELTAISALGGIVLGTMLALARLSGNRWLAKAVGAYVNGLRAIPLLLVIFWFYFLMPYVLGWITAAKRPVEIPPLSTTVITFILFEAAYFCEIMRAGIQSIPPGQLQAARALGMGYWRIMGDIILPQAFRNMLPVLLNQIVILFQDVSLVSVLSIKDFFGVADFIAKRDGHPHELYLTVAAVYLVACVLLSRGVKVLERRVAIIR